MAMNANDALDAIHETMSGQRWTPETLEAIAEIMTAAGRPLADYDELPLPGCVAEKE